MSEQKTHQLLMLFLASCAAIALALLYLTPVLGVLWILLIVLLCVILSMVRPALWRAEKARWIRRLHAIRKTMTGTEAAEEGRTPPVYDLVMVRPADGRRYPVNKKVYLIGRSGGCDCRLSGAATIGREHCRIIYREHSKEYYIEDLRSKNGTYLGTRRLEPHTQVKLLENAELSVGDCCLRFVKRQGM